MGYKIITLDIETAPAEAYVWGPKWETNVIEFIHYGYMLTFAVKVYGQSRVKAYSIWDYPRQYAKDRRNDSELVKQLREELCDADLVIGHNIDKFDLRTGNTQTLLHDLPPPSPYRTYDTLKELRRIAKMQSNKLADATEFFGLPSKLETGGFKLWKACMDSDPETSEPAKRKMVRYCKHDVVLTELLYDKLKPWSKSHPNVTIGSGQSYLCPVCAWPTRRGGTNKAKSWRTQRFMCLNPDCAKWSSGPREKKTEVLLT